MKVSGQQLNYTLLYGNAYNPATTPSELSGSAELGFLSIQYVYTVSLCHHISLVCGWKWLIMQGMVKKEQMVLKMGWVEVNDAITVMDYTESEDAVLYHLRAGALCSLKEKKNYSLSLSFFLCPCSFDRLSSGIDLFFHLFLFMRFVVDKLSVMSC